MRQDDDEPEKLEPEQLQHFLEGVAAYYFDWLSFHLGEKSRIELDQSTMKRRSDISLRAIKDSFKAIDPETRKFAGQWRLASKLRNKSVKMHFQMHQVMSTTCLAKLDINLAHAHLWGVLWTLLHTPKLARVIDATPAYWRVTDGLAIMKIDELQRSRGQRLNVVDKSMILRAYTEAFQPLTCLPIPGSGIAKDQGRPPRADTAEQRVETAASEFAAVMAHSMLLLQVPTVKLSWDDIKDNGDGRLD